MKRIRVERLRIDVPDVRTCRFCDHFGKDLLKYGTRHYAHHACYLDAGKTLSDLHSRQVRQFPVVLILERGLAEQADRICESVNWRALAAAYRSGREAARP